MGHLEEQRAEVRTNFATFQAALPELLSQFQGKYAVLRHAKLEGIFDSFAQALDYCGATYSDRLFSIQEITPESLEAGSFLHAADQDSVRSSHWASR